MIFGRGILVFSIINKSLSLQPLKVINSYGVTKGKHVKTVIVSYRVEVEDWEIILLILDGD